MLVGIERRFVDVEVEIVRRAVVDDLDRVVPDHPPPVVRCGSDAERRGERVGVLLPVRCDGDDLDAGDAAERFGVGAPHEAGPDDGGADGLHKNMGPVVARRSARASMASTAGPSRLWERR